MRALSALLWLLLVPLPALARPAGGQLTREIKAAEAELQALKPAAAAARLQRAVKGSARAPAGLRARAFAVLGWARAEAQDPAGAEAAFSRALRLDPKVRLSRRASPKLRAQLEALRSKQLSERQAARPTKIRAHRAGKSAVAREKKPRSRAAPRRAGKSAAAREKKPRSRAAPRRAGKSAVAREKKPRSPPRAAPVALGSSAPQPPESPESRELPAARARRADAGAEATAGIFGDSPRVAARPAGAAPLTPLPGLDPKARPSDPERAWVSPPAEEEALSAGEIALWAGAGAALVGAAVITGVLLFGGPEKSEADCPASGGYGCVMVHVAPGE